MVGTTLVVYHELPRTTPQDPLLLIPSSRPPSGPSGPRLESFVRPPSDLRQTLVKAPSDPRQTFVRASSVRAPSGSELRHETLLWSLSRQTPVRPPSELRQSSVRPPSDLRQARQALVGRASSDLRQTFVRPSSKLHQTPVRPSSELRQ